MKYQPLSEDICAYPEPIEFGERETKVDSRELLWASVSALMKKHYGRENLTKLAKDCEIGPATASRMKAQQTSVGLDVIDRIAKRFHVEPWSLLVPGFNPDHAPTLQPLSAREAELYERFKAVAKELINQG